MKISYKTTIDEAVDCYVRKWRLHKNAKLQVFKSIFLFMIIWAIFTYLFASGTLNTFKSGFIKSFVFFTTMALYLLYTYTIGLRRHARKAIIYNLDGELFSENFSCEITPSHILATTDLAETRFEWSHVKNIRIYKQYIEIVGRGFLIHLRSSESPPIDEIIAVWKQAETTR